MDWIHIVQKSIQYTEAMLGDPRLSPKQIAQYVHMSESHLTRAFHTLTNISLSEYIRNRRLTIAGERLQCSDVSVLDIAHDVGYESPESFSKAFRRYHGFNPSDCKTMTLKPFYPLQLKIVLTQEKPLQYEVQSKDSFYLCGKIHTVTSSDSNATAYLWAQCETQGYLDTCYQFKGFSKLVGVSSNQGYTVKAICTQANLPHSKLVPASKWVVFTCEGVGPQGILNTWDRIYSTWIPRSEYDIADLPQLEVYHINDSGYTCEIWIPVTTSL